MRYDLVITSERIVTMPKFIDAFIYIESDGPTGNAFYIMGAAKKAMLEVGATELDVKEYMEKAKSGDYENLKRVTEEYITVLWIE
jgi:hypothetical protein